MKNPVIDILVFDVDSLACLARKAGVGRVMLGDTAQKVFRIRPDGRGRS